MCNIGVCQKSKYLFVLEGMSDQKKRGRTHTLPSCVSVYQSIETRKRLRNRDAQEREREKIIVFLFPILKTKLKYLSFSRDLLIRLL